MNSQVHNGYSTNPSSNPKPHKAASLAHKLELLDSNVNRVSHQHETLLQLISDQERIGRFRASVEAIGMAAGRFQRWKEAGLPVLGELSFMGKYRWANSDSKYEGELKQVQAQLHRLRQQLSTIKKHQWSTQKQSSTTLTQKLSTQKQSTLNQLQTLQKNTHKYLTKVKQQISAQHEERVMDFAGGYLRVEGELCLEEIQADLGMLVCQLEYERGRRIRGEIQGMGGEIGVESGEMALGKLERTLAVQELAQFKTQTHKHLSHSCQLLLKKLQLAISCLKITTKSKHKNLNISQKYNEEQQEFQDWLRRIQSDLEGMRMRVRHLDNKIRVLEYKLGIEGGEGQEKDGEEEVERLLGCCREKLELFCKLKLEYVCNMR